MRAAAWFVFLLLLSAGVTLLAMTTGAKPMSFTEVWQTLLGNGSRTNTIIMWSVRLPRSLTAFAAGAGLAVSGYLMQVLMRNMLASPNLTGAMSGALAVVVPLHVFWPGVSVLLYPFIGVGGALLAAAVVLLSARDVQASPYRLALVGFAMALFLNGIMSYLMVRGGLPSPSLMFWLAGGFQGRSWLHLQVMLPWVALGVAGALLCARVVSLLTLDDAVASGMGLRVAWWRRFLLLIAVLPVAGVASVAGAVAFVGLAVPHWVTLLRPRGAAWTIALNAAAGGLLLVSADAVARTLAAPREIPVGVMTALLGAPVVIRVVRRVRPEAGR